MWKKLVDSGVRRNDGTWQSEWIKSKKLDICFSCANQIFDIFIVDKIPEEELIEHLEKIKPSLLGFGVNIDPEFSIQPFIGTSQIT